MIVTGNGKVHYSRKLIKRLTENPIMNWISVKDKLPDDYESVLICVHYLAVRSTSNLLFIGYYSGHEAMNEDPANAPCIDNNWHWSFTEPYSEDFFSNNKQHFKVTHWMPLPNEPEPEK